MNVAEELARRVRAALGSYNDENLAVSQCVRLVAAKAQLYDKPAANMATIRGGTMSEEKYKQFRNYMTNELGITRQDIEAWAKESVAREVNKRLDRMLSYDAFEARLTKKIEEMSVRLRERIDNDLRTYIRQELKAQIGQYLVESMHIELLPPKRT